MSLSLDLETFVSGAHFVLSKENQNYFLTDIVLSNFPSPFKKLQRVHAKFRCLRTVWSYLGAGGGRSLVEGHSGIRKQSVNLKLKMD